MELITGEDAEALARMFLHDDYSGQMELDEPEDPRERLHGAAPAAAAPAQSARVPPKEIKLETVQTAGMDKRLARLVTSALMAQSWADNRAKAQLGGLCCSICKLAYDEQAANDTTHMYGRYKCTRHVSI